jgi:RNA polymerase sigma-70 factor (ECF subfamily)
VHALDAHIDRHRAELLAFLARRAPEDAEELAQETWLRVARAAPDCADDARFRAYAFTVARRLLVDHWRAKGARVRLVALDGGPEPVDPAGDPSARVRLADVLRIVEAELGVMQPEQADVFRWRTAEGTSFADIAARQGTGINTALGRMHRATLRLAAALRKQGFGGKE